MRMQYDLLRMRALSIVKQLLGRLLIGKMKLSTVNRMVHRKEMQNHWHYEML